MEAIDNLWWLPAEDFSITTTVLYDAQTGQRLWMSGRAMSCNSCEDKGLCASPHELGDGIHHWWSGWPGAYCMGCGAEDPLEMCLAYSCPCTCHPEYKPCAELGPESEHCTLEYSHTGPHMNDEEWQKACRYAEW